MKKTSGQKITDRHVLLVWVAAINRRAPIALAQQEPPKQATSGHQRSLTKRCPCREECISETHHHDQGVSRGAGEQPWGMACPASNHTGDSGVDQLN